MTNASSNRTSLALLGIGAGLAVGAVAAVASNRPATPKAPVPGQPAPSGGVVITLPGSGGVSITLPGLGALLPAPAPVRPTPPATGSGPLIVIDPGHGTPDPGTTAGKVSEAAANLAVSLTLAAQLKAAGFKVLLTRTGPSRPAGNDQQSYDYRTAYRTGQLCLISVHHNSPSAPGNLSGALVFRQQHRRDSSDLAARIARECGIRVLDTWESNFSRLYIDNARAPAVLWEVTAINNYRDSGSWRSSMCAPVVRAVRAWAAAS